MSKNVIIIGQSGVGKSSLINMICHRANAPTSNDTTGCTREEKGYTCNLGGQLSCQVHDTIGLEEGFWGFLFAPKAEKRLKTYLKDSRKPWHLMVYCIPGNRGLKKSHARNFKKFKSVADKLGVPVVVVVTHLEDFGGSLKNWWLENLDTLKNLGIPDTTKHACVTALPKEELDKYYKKGQLYDDSCRDVKNLIRSILWPSTGHR
ncbi:P-loop containing nucleoside triphosphate hydrolase protein [Suillus fuscotomentosus]|uniref:P-loop containing nucleoside triphosphate hydrolase protein n=1 Tax=Suillus fuscotomentosus TaxID=1912939 RepID=A0AAD4HIJ9_9AGAM|nr:P-loop containing nucleoside triphosphate hydrolase protein [Suillus fuscotomentosus]KAG1897807.1 P-loop containing nucleoside triphosphate hydrolase protein [Suillus fuscotomentosus]